jgi:cyclopropane fatty-acyl-phospholipid synthase-like methyltransferase
MKATNNKEADNIFDTWEIYRKIVAANNMFHDEIYADVANILATAPHGFSLLDLGCGDAANLTPVLVQLPIGHYAGVDLSATALAFAAQNLKTLACPVNFYCGDLLQELNAQTACYDVIFTSFALHHLSFGQKAEFFKAAYAHLNPFGFLLLIDTVRDGHEDLPGYLNAYCDWLQTTWQGIDEQEKGIACEHIAENDFPETLTVLQVFSQQANFSACHLISRYKWHHVLRFQR